MNDSFWAKIKQKLKNMWQFWLNTADEHMGAFAAQTAFFLFLSFFPIISIALTIPKYLPFSKADVVTLVLRAIPGKFESFVVGIIDEIYMSSISTTIISILLAFWSASKGLMSIRNGLNEVYRSRENRNYFVSRGISTFYTVLFVVFMLLLIPLNIFGTQIAHLIIDHLPEAANVTLMIYSIRLSATFVVLFFMFWMLYTIVPTKKNRFRDQIPGALFTATSWVLVTKLYSLYMDNIAMNNYMYGSLTMVVLLLIWLYLVIYLLFCGAQLNEFRTKMKEQKRKQFEDGKDASAIEKDDQITDKRHEREYLADLNQEMDQIIEGIEKEKEERIELTLIRENEKMNEDEKENEDKKEN